MLISYRRQFIFIHVPKVAGMSIDKALKGLAFRPELYPWNRWLRRMNIKSTFPYINEKTFGVHAAARELKRELPPQIFDTFFKFAFVRNPWDLHVSLYHYILHNKHHFMHETVKALGGFDAFIEHICPDRCRSQLSFLADEDGALLVDFVGRYENLRDDFHAVCQRLGVKCSLPHVNASRHRNYRWYYNARTAALVREACRVDVERFGYEFDSQRYAPIVADSPAGSLRRAA